MKGVRLNVRKGCFMTVKGRALRGAHSMIKQWYAGGFNPAEAKRLASETAMCEWIVGKEEVYKMPKPGFANGSRIDLEMHRWAASGEMPKHPVAKMAVDRLLSEGFTRFQGKHGVKSRTDYVYTEIDFLVQKNAKVYAVELKSGYDVEFYQSTGKMAHPLSAIDNSLCNQAIVQVYSLFVFQASIDAMIGYNGMVFASSKQRNS
jgi:hypothetical protein